MAGEVTSFAVREAGPGGPALLYTTRKGLMYTVLFAQLPAYRHRELTAAAAGTRPKGHVRCVVGRGGPAVGRGPCGLWATGCVPLSSAA